MSADPAKAINLPKALGATLLFSLAASAAMVTASGVNLGMLFGAIALAAILIPPMSLVRAKLGHALLICAMVCDGLAIPWLIALWNAPVTLIQLLLCYVLMIGWCAALFGLTLAMARFFRDEITSSAIVVVLAMLWLSSLIWLPASTGAPVDGLLAVHPLFALNGLLKELGIWTQQPIAYKYLFTLGQDVPYVLPATVWPCVALHSLIGMVGIGIGRVRGRT
jgi:hypothetical protein